MFVFPLNRKTNGNTSILNFVIDFENAYDYKIILFTPNKNKNKKDKISFISNKNLRYAK